MHRFTFISHILVLTNLADELPELVQVALSVRSKAQLSNAAVKLLSSLKWILQHKQLYSPSAHVAFCVWLVINQCLFLPSDSTGPLFL